MAVVDFFLTIPGVEGESLDPKGAIVLESWSWGEAQTPTRKMSGGAAGQVAMRDFHCVMSVSKASPKLMEACATGKNVGEVKLICRRAAAPKEEYLKWTFSDVLISSYQCSGKRDSDIVPTDEITLNFAKIKAEYTEGNVVFEYTLPV
jgi:type VI secretion system secreted protein Hcp